MLIKGNNNSMSSVIAGGGAPASASGGVVVVNGGGSGEAYPVYCYDDAEAPCDPFIYPAVYDAESTSWVADTTAQVVTSAAPGVMLAPLAAHGAVLYDGADLDTAIEIPSSGGAFVMPAFAVHVFDFR